MKEKLKKIIQFLLNPRLLLCFGIGWMITNGWYYILLGVGAWFDIPWMVAVAGNPGEDHYRGQCVGAASLAVSPGRKDPESVTGNVRQGKKCHEKS